MFLLAPAYPGSPGQKAVKRLCVCVCVCVCVVLHLFYFSGSELLKQNKINAKRSIYFILLYFMLRLRYAEGLILSFLRKSHIAQRKLSSF